MVRRRLLQALFRLLYGPLAPIHEIAGQMAFGGAWAGRRALLLSRLRIEQLSPGILLDLGCGEGRLLAEAATTGIIATGVDPSSAMLRRARRSGCQVILGSARQLPLRTESIFAVCSTYPGPWIFEAETWQEIGRVLVPGGRVGVLLGGTVERGRRGRLRSLAGSLVYGVRPCIAEEVVLPALGNDLVHGEWTSIDDHWGTAMAWFGRRVDGRLPL